MALTLTKTLPARSESDLVAATRAGDDRAFEELYARYRPRIFAFVASRVHDHGRAEDVAQEVFISALRRLRATDQPIAFKPWIYEIAKNACIDEFRRDARTPEIPLETEEDLSPSRGTTVSVVLTPPSAVESKQRLDDLRGAFGGLSESHHRLLVMREFEDLSYDEIGDRLGMTRQMVESSLFRARRKLTEEYEELASGRRCRQVQTAIAAGDLHSTRSLGVRQRRRFGRHLAHCQACRHVALAAGVDDALVRPRRVGSKIAALLPFPVWRLLRRGGRGAAGSSSATTTALPTAAGTASCAGAAGLSLGPAAAALVAVAVAGAGVGALQASGASAPHPTVTVAPAAARTHTGASSPVAGARARSTMTRSAQRSTNLKPKAPTVRRHPGAASAQSGDVTTARSAAGSVTGSGRTAASAASGRDARAPTGSGSRLLGTSRPTSGAGSGAVKTTVGRIGAAGGGASGVGRVVSSTGLGVVVSGATGAVRNAVSGTVGGVTGAVGSVVSGVVGGTVGGAVGGVTGAAGSSVAGAVSGVTGAVGSGAAGAVSGATGALGSLSGAVGGHTATGGSGSSTTNSPSTVGSVAHAASSVALTALAGA